MNSDYIITLDELNDDYGLPLEQLTIDSANTNTIIRRALEMAITKCLSFNDNFAYESDIETALDENENLVKPFKKLQHEIIYNLCYLGDSDPIDNYSVERIITFDLGWGKINGFQKGLYRR